LHGLEWSVPDDAELDDFQAVKRANPAPWITVSDLRRQRATVPESVFAQFPRLPLGRRRGFVAASRRVAIVRRRTRVQGRRGRLDRR
jgi:hypothetical protein